MPIASTLLTVTGVAPGSSILAFRVTATSPHFISSIRITKLAAATGIDGKKQTGTAAAPVMLQLQMDLTTFAAFAAQVARPVPFFLNLSWDTGNNDVVGLAVVPGAVLASLELNEAEALDESDEQGSSEQSPVAPLA